MPRHSASSANNAANGPASPRFSDSAALRSSSIKRRVCRSAFDPATTSVFGQHVSEDRVRKFERFGNGQAAGADFVVSGEVRICALVAFEKVEHIAASPITRSL